MRNGLVRRGLGLGLVGLLAACGGGGSGASSAPPVVVATAPTALSVCTAASVAQFERLAACQGATAAAQLSWKAGGAAFCDAVAREVAAGRTAFDASRAASCQAALAALDCAGAAAAGASPGAGLSVPACAAAFSGVVADGAGCIDDLDCASGYCTAAWAGTCPGACAPRAAAGTSCLDRPCADGLACDYTAGGICRVPSSAGGPCPCAAGTWCDRSGSSPQCRPVQQGGACPGPWACAPGLVCAGAPATCRLPASEGTACDPSMAGCAPGLACDPVSLTCKPAPGMGQTCVVSRGGATYTLACQDGWCDTGKTLACQALGADGQACRSDVECRGRCDGATARCVGASGLACNAP